MDEILISCKITSIHPHFDNYGNEFVCIEFGIEAQKPPTVMAMPSNVPQEMSIVMPLLSQIPKMFTPGKIYANRMVLFLTKLEWERLLRKYQYNDDVEIKISKDGTIQVNPLKV